MIIISIILTHIKWVIIGQSIGQRKQNTPLYYGIEVVQKKLKEYYQKDGSGNPDIGVKN
jgi:hypothetical protein